MGNGDTQDWTTEKGVAHHEAGHYVAFLHLRANGSDAEFGTLTIVPDEEGGSLGRFAPLDGAPEGRLRPLTDEEKAEYERQGWPTDREIEEFDPKDIENYIVELYAGGAAELRHSPEGESARWHLAHPDADEEATAESVGPFRAGQSDREKAEAWLAWVAPDRVARAELRDQLKHRAKDFVEEKWTEIVIVAGELMTWKTIDGYEAALAIRIAAGDTDAEIALEEYRELRRGQ